MIEPVDFAPRVKKQLRSRMRALLGALPASAVGARSARINERLLELEALSSARGVALFWPMEDSGEVDLRALDEVLERRGVARYYPFMDPTPTGFSTGFRRIERASELARGERRFYEPPRTAPSATAGDIDVVIVPALAATPDGHRLGQGKGFYDVTLPDVCPPARSVIVAYSFQVLGELPIEGHDYRCDWVVTDDQTYSAASPVATR
jgi:5-formyltetrahydrofolate cyclo-ligase